MYLCNVYTLIIYFWTSLSVIRELCMSLVICNSPWPVCLPHFSYFCLHLSLSDSTFFVFPFHPNRWLIKSRVAKIKLRLTCNVHRGGTHCAWAARPSCSCSGWCSPCWSGARPSAAGWACRSRWWGRCKSREGATRATGQRRRRWSRSRASSGASCRRTGRRRPARAAPRRSGWNRRARLGAAGCPPCLQRQTERWERKQERERESGRETERWRHSWCNILFVDRTWPWRKSKQRSRKNSRGRRDGATAARQWQRGDKIENADWSKNKS